MDDVNLFTRLPFREVEGTDQTRLRIYHPPKFSKAYVLVIVVSEVKGEQGVSPWERKGPPH